MAFQLTSIQRKVLRGILAVAAMVRLLSLGSYPLADTTEARYGEIARLMAQTGDWITPQIHQGVPFWGKPPLSTWLSALSIRVLGVNEFAIRLPSFLLALLVLALVYFVAVRQRGRDFALVATVVLALSVLFFVSSGAVMTDPALLLGTTLSMIAFWRAMTAKKSRALVWGYLFFVGLSIGLLAKGPVALILVGLPVGGWVLWQRQWGHVWRRLPWFSGLALCLALSAPWYYLAELKTPGFLDYFLIGEHWKRFMVSGWQGDLYGNAHSRPLGTIWLYWLVTALPWSLVLLASLFRKEFRQKAGLMLRRPDGWGVYLMLWSVAPMVFFTLAGNILWTYVLPGLPAFALLVAELMLPDQAENLARTISPEPGLGKMMGVAVTTTLLFVSAWLLIAGQIVPAKKCQKELVAAYQAVRVEEAGDLIYLFKRPHSAEFYSRGQALLAEQPAEVNRYFQNSSNDYFAIKEGDLRRLPTEVRQRVAKLGEFNGYYLLKEKSRYDSEKYSRQYPESPGGFPGEAGS
ncbi:glycosyltransferase family 39 protein [Desulfuromonas sp. KJ2020]|uniref:ArnT family glycosyltransferase n=1 Tax=Desulfuromonas sp. KJ2020 TaxID=2919173 RepID=UPI0020A767D1|nr:glycosyltransferase family 39 protein [Desulfuromonas sp. KJ2020]MCP3176220.1 glycosyltransferase family 39 protein [Desulfuromonas sp. KJ2020]